METKVIDQSVLNSTCEEIYSISEEERIKGKLIHVSGNTLANIDSTIPNNRFVELYDISGCEPTLFETVPVKNNSPSVTLHKDKLYVSEGEQVISYSREGEKVEISGYGNLKNIEYIDDNTIITYNHFSFNDDNYKIFKDNKLVDTAKCRCCYLLYLDGILYKFDSYYSEEESALINEDEVIRCKTEIVYQNKTFEYSDLLYEDQHYFEYVTGKDENNYGNHDACIYIKVEEVMKGNYTPDFALMIPGSEIISIDKSRVCFSVRDNGLTVYKCPLPTPKSGYK